MQRHQFLGFRAAIQKHFKYLENENLNFTLYPAVKFKRGPFTAAQYNETRYI